MELRSPFNFMEISDNNIFAARHHTDIELHFVSLLLSTREGGFVLEWAYFLPFSSVLEGRECVWSFVSSDI